MRTVLDTFRRTPIVNLAPVPLSRTQTRRPGLLFGRHDVVTQLAQYGQLGTLWSIVHTRATAIAQVEWRLTRLDDRAIPVEDRAEVSHRAMDVWNQPTPFHERDEMLEIWSMHRDLSGEAFWLPALDRLGIPAEIWWARPDRFTPVEHATEFLRGWLYRTPDGDEVPLAPEQVHQFKLPNPLDPYRGLGPVQALMVDIESAKEAARWNWTFFKNSALPGGVIEVPDRLSEPEWQEMTDRWREQHQGTNNSHRVAVLERGVWKDRSFSIRDLEFPELRRLSDEQLRQAFGMSKTMLGLTEDVNRATAETAEVVQARRQDLPRLGVLKRWLNHRFLPLFGPTTASLEFDFVSPVPKDNEWERKDRDSRVRSATMMIKAGAEPVSTLEHFGLSDIIWASPETDADTEGGPSQATAADVEFLAQIAQKVYLATDGNKVLTRPESRTLMNMAGANLAPEAPPDDSTDTDTGAAPPALPPGADSELDDLNDELSRRWAVARDRMLTPG